MSVEIKCPRISDPRAGKARQYAVKVDKNAQDSRTTDRHISKPRQKREVKSKDEDVGGPGRLPITQVGAESSAIRLIEAQSQPSGSDPPRLTLTRRTITWRLT
jgi:hypothetical protein